MKKLIPVASAFLVLSNVVQAQSIFPNAVQASFLYNALSGSSYKDLSGGPGLEVQVRRSLGVWSVGGGVQFMSHGIKHVGGVSGTNNFAGLFLEPRYVFATKSNVAPYLSARFAVIRQSISYKDLQVGLRDVSASAPGAQINAGGGVLFPISDRASFDVGATYGLVSLGAPTSNTEGVSVTSESTSGSNLVLRVGISIGLGKQR